MNFKEQAIYLRQLGFMTGNRPVFVKILKGDYPYKGKYVVTFASEVLYFYELKFNYNYKGKKARDFKISYANLTGYRYTVAKGDYKQITLIFTDGLEFNLWFNCNPENAKDNEANATALMKKLKEMNVLQKNIIKGGKSEQRKISKRDQLFTKEVRSPSKKRGIFG